MGFLIKRQLTKNLSLELLDYMQLFKLYSYHSDHQIAKPEDFHRHNDCLMIDDGRV